MPHLASWESLDPCKMNMLLWDPLPQITIGRMPCQTATCIILGRSLGLVETATHLPPAAQHQDEVLSDVPEKGRIVKNLVASLRQAVCGVIKKVMLQLWTLLWDGEQILLQDGGPQTPGNPHFGTWFMDTLPDALIGMKKFEIDANTLHASLVDSIYLLGMRSTTMSQMPSTSWT